MFDYFYGNENENFIFLQVPLALVKDVAFKKVTGNAKLLYGLLLNRTHLSKKNNWFDEDNRLYIIYTIDEIMEDLNCSNKTAGDYLKELEKIGLIQKKRLGQGKANIIYVMNFTTSLNYKRDLTNVENTKKCKNYTSRNVKTTCLEVYKLHTSNKELNNNDFNNNNIEKDLVVVKDQEKQVKKDIKETCLKNFDIKIDTKTVNIIYKIIKENKKDFKYFLEKIELTKKSYVDDITAFLISALKNDYKKSKGNKKRNGFNNFESRNIDFEKLERLENELTFEINQKKIE